MDITTKEKIFLLRGMPFILEAVFKTLIFQKKKLIQVASNYNNKLSSKQKGKKKIKSINSHINVQNTFPEFS